MQVGFARVIWAEYIAPYSITDRGIAPESGGMGYSLKITPKALANFRPEGV
jgi:hypothetical protein